MQIPTSQYHLLDHKCTNIISRLSDKNNCRFRSVCIGWNNLLTSSQFIARWIQQPIDASPWLVMQHFGQAYHFFDLTWRNEAAICLLDIHIELAPKLSIYEVSYCSSAIGLFLVRVDTNDFKVCNLLIRMWLSLLDVVISSFSHY